MDFSLISTSWPVINGFTALFNHSFPELHFSIAHSINEWRYRRIGREKRCIIVDLTDSDDCIHYMNSIITSLQDNEYASFIIRGDIYKYSIGTFDIATHKIISEYDSLPVITEKIRKRNLVPPTRYKSIETQLKLTMTEWSVLYCLRQGRSNAGVANFLGKSNKTISAHKNNVKKRLEMNSNVNFYKWLVSDVGRFILDEKPDHYQYRN